jgi:hypothetical protein
MNATQKWISIGFTLALVLGSIRPPWQQTYKGVRLSYAGELGQHFLWQRPPAMGEKSWMVIAPASECEVSIDEARLSWQCGTLVVITAVLFFAFRTRSRTLAVNDNETDVAAPDWKYTGVAALVLTFTAAFVVFVVHPGGFEGQIGWFYILWPGAFVYGTIATDVDKIAPALLRDSLIAVVILGASLLCYFAICDASIASYRLLRSRFKAQGDQESR